MTYNITLHHNISVHHIRELYIISENCTSYQRTVHHIRELYIISENCTSYSENCTSYQRTVHRIQRTVHHNDSYIISENFRGFFWVQKQVISAFYKGRGVTKKGQGAMPCKNGLGKTLTYQRTVHHSGELYIIRGICDCALH